MKHIIIAAACMIASTILQAQWPVNKGSQGEITGTIGEVRGTSGSPRIHNGTDCTGGSDLKVYSIKNDEIKQINYASSLGVNRNIEMKSGAQYFHVTYPANRFQIDEINAGRVTVKVAQKEAFAEMIQSGNWPTHVHMQNANRDNFLTTDGFGSPSFAFKDNVAPQFGSDNIKIYKDLADARWNQSYQFAEYVSDEGYATNERPLVIWGDVDLTANVFQNRVGSNGNSLNLGALAPYRLGYQLESLAANSIDFQDFNRFQFDNGTVPANYRIVHAKKSTGANPILIVSNQLVNGSAREGNLPTATYRDGDYELTVRAENTQGSSIQKAIKVRLDNYRTYIQKVTVKDGDGQVRYESEWSALTRANDGSIQVDRRNNEPFVNGATCTIEVTTSESVPSLQLKLAGGKAVTLTKIGDAGKTWGGSFVLPSNSASKVQLSFESGTRLFGLLLNQDYADVKRQENDKFLASGSTDKNHELRICEGVDEPLSLEVNVDQTFENVTLVATGGTPPYEFSQDLAPVPPNLKSKFSTGNAFPIVFDQNYLFKVRDSGGCEAQEYYTLPNVPCDAQNFAGGQGTDIRQVNLGTVEGTVSVAYEMYSIPDQLTVSYRGSSQTTGIVSGSGVLSFEHTLVEGQSNQVTITVNAPNSGTAWTYQVICPDATVQTVTPRSISQEENVKFDQAHARLSYDAGSITISGYDDQDGDLYTVRYRQIDETEWTLIPQVTLPYHLSSSGKELEIELEKEAPEGLITNLRVFPNPSKGTVNIGYLASKNGIVELYLYNSLGELVGSQEYSVVEGDNTFQWNPGEKHSGLTFVRVLDQSKLYTASLVISKR